MAGNKRTVTGAAGTIRVRQFREDDAEAAAVVMQQAFRSFLPGKKGQNIPAHYSPENLRSSCTYRQKDAMAVSYVAEEAGSIVGYVHGSISRHGSVCCRSSV